MREVFHIKDYEKTGVLTLKDIKLPSEEQLKKGVAIVECVQKIPCDPCVAICPVETITMEDINDIPNVDFSKCTGCARCVDICPGLAIFIVKVIDNIARITLPYEFLPIPKAGDTVTALNREGKAKGKAKVIRVNQRGKTSAITIEVKRELAMDVRNIRVVDNEK